MVHPPAVRTSSRDRSSPGSAPSARVRAVTRAAHGALGAAFLLALVSGGRWPWLHVAAGLTMGFLAWAGLLGWLTGAFRAGQSARFSRFAGTRARPVSGDSAALLVCLAGLSATGLGRWLAGAGELASAAPHPGGAWALAHESFRLAALVLLAIHLLCVLRTATRRAGHSDGRANPALEDTDAESREPTE